MRTILICTASLFLGIGFIALIVSLVKWIKGDAPLRIEKLPSESDMRQADLERSKNLGKVTRGWPVKPKGDLK